VTKKVANEAKIRIIKIKIDQDSLSIIFVNVSKYYKKVYLVASRLAKIITDLLFPYVSTKSPNRSISERNIKGQEGHG
jgi:hypothetical protein